MCVLSWAIVWLPAVPFIWLPSVVLSPSPLQAKRLAMVDQRVANEVSKVGHWLAKGWPDRLLGLGRSMLGQLWLHAAGLWIPAPWLDLRGTWKYLILLWRVWEVMYTMPPGLSSSLRSYFAVSLCCLLSGTPSQRGRPSQDRLIYCLVSPARGRDSTIHVSWPLHVNVCLQRQAVL